MLNLEILAALGDTVTVHPLQMLLQARERRGEVANQTLARLVFDLLFVARPIAVAVAVAHLRGALSLGQKRCCRSSVSDAGFILTGSTCVHLFAQRKNVQGKEQALFQGALSPEEHYASAATF